MTLTSAEVAKLQKHNADLVRENETLTRDNAELRGQVVELERVVLWFKLRLKNDCTFCVNSPCKLSNYPCNECLVMNRTNTDFNIVHFEFMAIPENWQPPDA